MKHRIRLLAALLSVWHGVFIIAAVEPSSQNPSEIFWNNFANLGGIRLQDQCNETIEEIQYYLQLGAEAIQKTNETDIIIVIGLSGSGKSTLVQFVANNSNTLRAVCEWEDCSLIDDSGSIGGDPVSQTFIPNLVVEDITSTPFYDMPGFNDNRNQTIEIANSIFIRQIISQAKRMKIIITQRQASLVVGDRISFVQTLKNLVKLIKVPEKFARSLALVGTVADYNKKDESLKGMFLAFIRSYIENAEALFAQEDVPTALAILNILVQTETEGGTMDPKYFGYFQSPAQDGPLLNDTKFVDSKSNLTALIMDKLEFAPIEEDDFGLPLSADALLLLTTTAGCTSKSVSTTMEDFAASLNSHIITEMARINTTSTENLNELSSLISHLTSGDYSFADITGEAAEFYLYHLRNNVASLSTGTNDTLVQLDKYIQMFTFITPTGVEYSVEPKPWVQPLKDLMLNVTEIISSFAGYTSKLVSTTMDDFADSLISHITTKMETINTTSTENLNELSSLLTNLTSGDYSFADITGEANEFYLYHLRNNVASLSTGTNDTLVQLDKHSRMFTFITSTGVKYSVEPKPWVQPLKDLMPNVTEIISSFAGYTSKSVSTTMEDFAASLNSHITTKMETINTTSTENLNELSSLLTNLTSGDYSFADIDGETVQFYLHNLRNNVASLNTGTNDTLVQLDKHSRMFTFITSTGVEYSVEPKPWVQPLKDLMPNVTEIISSFAGYTSKSVSTTMDNFADSLISHITTEMETINTASTENLNELSSLLTNLTSGDYSFGDIDGETAQFYLHNLRNNVASLSTGTNDTLVQLDKYIQMFTFITSTGVAYSVIPTLWVQPLKDLMPEVTKGISTFANSSQFETIEEIELIATKVYEKLLEELNPLSFENKAEKLTGLVRTLETLMSSIDRIIENKEQNIVELLTVYERDLSYLTSPPSTFQTGKKQVMAVFEIVSEFGWRSIKTWKSPVEKILDGVREILIAVQAELNYTKFIDALKIDLSTHQIQSNKEGDLVRWWSTAKTISVSNFPEFWTKISQEGLSAHLGNSREVISSIIFGSTDYVSRLTSLLDTYLSVKTCTGGTTDNAVIVSNFLSLKDALSNTSCLPARPTRQSITFIAMDTLYVDGSIKGSDYNENLDVFLVAPTIFLDPSVAIDLRGKQGVNGNNGGGPGQKGQQGGNFYFAYDAYDNRSSSVSMTVNLNGGDGGKGGKGSQGMKGENGIKKYFDHTEDYCGAYNDWANIQVRVYPNTCNTPGARCHAGDDGINVRIDGNEGKNGTTGYKGGTGGARGAGGSSLTYDGFGRVETKYGEQGSPGDGGEGGEGGIGGLYGETLIVNVDDHLSGGSYDCRQHGSTIEEISTKRASSGAQGPIGDLNTSNVNPRQPDISIFRSKTSVYIQKAEDMYNNQFIGEKVSDFVKKLEKI